MVTPSKTCTFLWCSPNFHNSISRDLNTPIIASCECILGLCLFFRKTARSESGDSSESSSGAPWLEKTGSRNASAEDREFWDLLDNAKRQSEEDDINNDDDDVDDNDDDEIEEDEEDGKQESSTETSTVQYDELR